MNSVRVGFGERGPGSRSTWLFIVALVCVAIPLGGSARAESEASDPATAEVTAATEESPRREDSLLFPRGELFEPLVADVSWPRFSVEHQWRFGNDEFDRLAAVSFGETFAFVRSPQYEWGEWEFGMQAMADAILDMTKRSYDLANDDYFVGFTGSVRTRGVTTQLRLYHISSHLGDEYLLENGAERGSVSYEAIDLLASFEPVKWLRVYGGGGSCSIRAPPTIQSSRSSASN